MEKTVQNIPFLRVVMALATGIYLGSAFPEINSNHIITSIVTFSIVSYAINRKYSFNLQTSFGILTSLIFLLFGIYNNQKYNEKPIFYEEGIFEATVLELPQEKTNSFQTVLNINTFIKNDSIFPVNEKIIAYFSKANDLKNLNSGSIILFKTNPQQIKNFGNPYEFDYKNYLERKKIYRQVYLDDKSWTATNDQTNSLIIIAERSRQKLLNIYQILPIDEKEREILSALTLGYKRDLDPETKRVFSSAGAMHVLAVSGLHVGIIFWIIIMLLGRLRKQKAGRLIFTLISILSLWSYAFITGLSPSVMRAATMFSIFILSEVLQRRPNIYNSLAASAFFLLIINPNNLFETGFQLSYSAVFGIVYLQPKISSLLNLKSKIPKFFWDLLCVSVAAQIATVPFTLYYFSQFPMYFWLTNIIIIPAIMLLIPLGILLLFISAIPFLANFIAVILNSLIKSIYFLLTHIEQLPYSVISTSISRSQQIILIALILSFFIILKSRKTIYVKVTLLGILLFISVSIFQNFNNHRKSEFIVYNNPDNITLELIHGKSNFIVSEMELSEEDQIRKTIEQTTQKRHLFPPQFITINDTITGQNLYSKNGIIYFEGKTILIGDLIHRKNINPDIIINPDNTMINNFISQNQDIIITNKRYIQNFEKNKNNILHTTYETAFQKIW